jgi:GDPmannose 4,6-dehydratase
VDVLLGDSSKAHEQLSWTPKTSFAELVRIMIEHDLRLARRERRLRELLEDDGDTLITADG